MSETTALWSEKSCILFPIESMKPLTGATRGRVGGVQDHNRSEEIFVLAIGTIKRRAVVTLTATPTSTPTPTATTSSTTAAT